MELDTAKGTRDISGIEMKTRRKVINIMQNLFNLYGYEELETPIIEKYDVLTYKYESGAPILKEIYSLTDQGGRELCLRYDHTVPLSRFIGMNQTMKLPYKRFAVGKVYRDGPVKFGRTREFVQCDFDIIGSKSVSSEIEILTMLIRFFKKINLNVRIEINNINFLKKLIEYFAIQKEDSNKVIAIIDKAKKQPQNELEKEMLSLGIEEEKAKKIFNYLNKSTEEILEFFENNFEDLEKEVEEMRQLLNYFKNENIELSLGLARGFSYYTGLVFETFMKDDEFSSSLAAGGRYDELIGNYLDNNREFPAVGGSFGIEPILAMLNKNSQTEESSNTKLFIIPLKTFNESQKIAEQIRNSGINVEIDITGKNVSKNMDYANAKKIEYIIVIGSNELESGKFKLKNMFTGKEEEKTIEEIIEVLKINSN